MSNDIVPRSTTDLVSYEVRPPDSRVKVHQLSMPMLAALAEIGTASPALVEGMRTALSTGQQFSVVFPKAAMKAYDAGRAHLLMTSTGAQATMVGAGGKFLANGRVIENASVASGAMRALSAASAITMLAGAGAAYAQQRKLEQALQKIERTVEGLHQRFLDNENGICAAAEAFLQLHTAASVAGSPYATAEMATHRQAIRALHEGRELYAQRFYAELGEAQTRREMKKGEPAPWVSLVSKKIKDEHLLDELRLYLRTLLIDVRLDLAVAAVLVEEGSGESAVVLLESARRRLRERFYQLHNRLRPLAEIAPDRRFWDALPMLGDRDEAAYSSIRALVERINADVLTSIPEPEDDSEPIALDVSPQDVSDVLFAIAA